MTIRIKPIRDTKRVLISVPRGTLNHKQSIQNALHLIGDVVGNRVKQLIEQGPKTGRIYRFRGRDHRASAPGEAPANRSGQLAKSFNYNVHGPFQMEIGESAPYAGFLEDGTRKMKPRPHFFRAIEETQGDAVRILYDEVEKVRKK